MSESRSINQAIPLFSLVELESSPDNLCVYGLGECPVLVILGDKMKAMEQRTKVIPADPGAAAVSQMIQPLLQMNANIYSMLPSFCPSCPKRILAIERELANLKEASK